MQNCLFKEDTELFFKLHPALLQYVNCCLKIFPKIKTAEALRNSGPKNVARVRAKLLERFDFIDEFISENPDGFSKEECNIIMSWKHAVRGRFYILKHLKKYSIFLTENEPTIAYGVHSLYTPLDEMFWNIPVYVEALLLPFRDCIIYDGILYPFSVTFGRGFHFGLDEAYSESKKKFGIVEKIAYS